MVPRALELTVGQREIVFLHSDRFVPPEVLAMVTGQIPPGFELHPLEQGETAAARRKAFASADYMLAYPGDPRPEELAAAPKLKLFQMLSAGHDWLDLDVFRDYGIPVAGNAGSNATTTAEHAVLLMLALLKQLPNHDRATRKGDWLGMRHTTQLRELRGKAVGLVGFGQIGQEVAQRVQAFGAKLQYTKRRPAPSEVEERLGATFVTLKELLATSDIVSLHAPLTPETRGMIGAHGLAAMKSGSWLVNTARGALVDEAALVEALRGGHLAGAGLDVFANEPLPGDHPLLGLENVVLTPHIGGVTADTWVRRLDVAWTNLRRVEAGLAPLARVA